MNVLVVDIGGTTVKILATGQDEPLKFRSGPKMTPLQMVSGIKARAGQWKYDVASIGYPGLVLHGGIVAEPFNLAPGWVGFNFEAAFECPVKLINDAAMQALGSYQAGTLLFWASEPVSAPPWWWKDVWFQWSWDIFLIETRPLRTISATGD